MSFLPKVCATRDEMFGNFMVSRRNMHPLVALAEDSVKVVVAEGLAEELHHGGRVGDRAEDALRPLVADLGAGGVGDVPEVDFEGVGGWDFSGGFGGAEVDEELAEDVLADLARTMLDAWERQMTKIYGVLVSELGKAKAERFFPKVRTKKTKTQPS